MQEIVLERAMGYDDGFYIKTEKQRIELTLRIGEAKKTYRELVSISEEALARKEKFLADYHTVRWLAKESGTNEYYVAKIAVALSNLLRLCEEYEVDEVYLVSMRIIRVRSENKTFFVIVQV